MKKISSLLFVIFCAAIFLVSCKKDNSIGGSNESTISFINPCFTPISISFNGETKQAPVGGNAVFTGTPSDVGNGQATTTGTTTSGTAVGLQLSWTLSQAFPKKGTNFNYTLNAGSDVFFLKMQNNSAQTISKIYVNYGLVGQTLDNVTVSNGGATYSLGYYKAFSNSNIRAENSSYYWTWTNLSLPFTQNQTKTVIAN